MIKNSAALISSLGRVPLLKRVLRNLAHRYRESSEITIKHGALAGARWKRRHRYVNGYWLGVYELDIQQCIVRELKAGDVFYDIGANAGFFSLLAARCVGPAGHVYSFDPLQVNVESIREQVEVNGLTNCTVVQAAVAEREGNIEFSEGRTPCRAHIARQGDEQYRRIQVKMITLDEFVRVERKPDFIKMDIEGAEVLALQGAQRLLAGSRPPKLLIELHGEEIAREVGDMLSQFGYAFYCPGRKPVPTSCLGHHVLAYPPVGRARNEDAGESVRKKQYASH